MTGIIMILAVTGILAVWLWQHINDYEASDIEATEAEHRIRKELHDIRVNRPECIVSTADSEYERYRVEWPDE